MILPEIERMADDVASVPTRIDDAAGHISPRSVFDLAHVELPGDLSRAAGR